MIGNLQRATGADKVTLLAHSMGGLASRSYLEIFDPGGNDVDRLITIGTPHNGTPLADLTADPVLLSNHLVNNYLLTRLLQHLDN